MVRFFSAPLPSSVAVPAGSEAASMPPVLMRWFRASVSVSLGGDDLQHARGPDSHLAGWDSLGEHDPATALKSPPRWRTAVYASLRVGATSGRRSSALQRGPKISLWAPSMNGSGRTSVVPVVNTNSCKEME
jgi:hypothetical protein